MATALCDVYLDYTTFHAAIEAVDDTKVHVRLSYWRTGSSKGLV